MKMIDKSILHFVSTYAYDFGFHDLTSFSKYACLP